VGKIRRREIEREKERERERERERKRERERGRKCGFPANDNRMGRRGRKGELYQLKRTLKRGVRKTNRVA
jgi:hypothetical protein